GAVHAAGGAAGLARRGGPFLKLEARARPGRLSGPRLRHLAAGSRDVAADVRHSELVCTATCTATGSKRAGIRRDESDDERGERSRTLEIAGIREARQPS